MASPKLVSLPGVMLVFFLGLLDPATSVTTYYMDQYCGSSIYMFGSILLELTDSYEYSSNMRCVVEVQSTGQYMNNIMAKVRWMDIEYSPSCTYDRLTIYDGEGTYYNKLTGRYGLCGSVAPSKNYWSSVQWITFNFTSDGSNEGRGFQILLTGYDNTGICTSDEYECDNGHCIFDYLTCNGYDNCGDNSDEDEGCSLSYAAITGITLGCVGGGIFLVGIVVAVAKRRSRAVYSRAQPAMTERTQFANGTQPYPAYGSPIAGQVPVQNTLPPAYNTLYSTGPPLSVQQAAPASKA